MMKFKTHFNQQLFILLVFLIPFLAKAEESDHPFHMSITEMFFNQETNTFEVALKIFTDDFEEVLRKKYGVGILDLGTKNESNKVDELIQDYMKKVFSLKVNDQPLTAHYIGKEGDLDAIWVYFEYSIQKEEMLTLTLENSVLHQLFDDQQNVIYFDYLNKKETYICLKDQARHKILR